MAVGRRRIAVAIAATLAAGGGGSFALTERLEALGLVFRSWDVADGLPQATVTGIAQTPDGYLWVTTFGGLGRFDGMQFHPAGVTDGIPPRLLRPFVDRHGTLWVLPETGGLWRRDAASGAFAEVPEAKGMLVYAMLVAEDGALWLGTDGHGAIRLKGDDRRSYGREQGLDSSFVTAIASGENGEIWLGTNRGLYRVANGVVRTFAAADGLPPGIVTTLLVRRDGSLAVGRADGMLCSVRSGSCRCEPLVTGETGRFVTGLVETRDGALWVSSFGGLYRVTGAGVDRLDEASGLGDPVVKAVYEDADGHLWVGTNVTGLVLLRPRSFTAYGKSSGLPSEQVLAVAVDGDGAPLVGLNCGPVMRITGGSAHPIAPGVADLNICAWSLLRDREGALWVGSWGAGALRWKDGVARRVGTRDGLSEDVVLALFERSSGEIWAGTLGAGACRVDTAPATCLTVKDGLAHDNVRGFAETPDGNLWIATSGGVTRVGTAGIASLGTREGMRSALARSLLVDGSGELWVGTYGGGIALLRDGVAHSVTTDEGLLDNVVSWIAEDDDGGFWLTGNRGVFRIARADLVAVAEGRLGRLYPLAFGVEDGMPTEECAGGFQPAGARTPDGRLWFPTLRGLVSVDPRALSRRAPRRAVIEGVRVDGRTVPHAGTISLPRDMRTLEIAYGGLDLAAARKLIFRYRLTGADVDWIDAAGRRAAYYGNLRAGSYRFAVQAFSPDGGWGPPAAELELVVPLVFWRTWWFLTLAACVTAALVFSLGAWRQALRSRRELETTEIARRLTAAILHEFRQPLQVLRTRVELQALREGAGLAAESDASRAIGRLGDLLERLERLQGVGGMPTRSYGGGETMTDLDAGSDRR